MIDEHGRVVLTEDRSDEDLQAENADEVAYEVEFFRLDEEAVAVETVSASAVRPVASTGAAHARTRTRLLTGECRRSSEKVEDGRGSDIGPRRLRWT